MTRIVSRVLVAMFIVACGQAPTDDDDDGGGGGGDLTPGAVAGRVDDGFGTPQGGSSVSINGPDQFTTTTDLNGMYAFAPVTPGVYQVTVNKAGFRVGTGNFTLGEGENRQFDLSLSPETQSIVAVAATRIVSMQAFGGLVFEADIIVLDDAGQPVPGLSASAFTMGTWVPWPSNSTMSTTQVSVTQMGGGGGNAFSALMLMDQSGSIASTDPTNSRLLAGKVFFNALGPGDLVQLAAFASGGSLPFDPVTIYGSTFTSNGPSYFGTLDQLANHVGGGTPLYSSTYSMLGYVAANAPGSNKALVVFTDGDDTQGGATVNDVVSRCMSTGVRLYMVGLGNGVSTDTLGHMTGMCGGTVMRASDARQLVSLYGTLGAILKGSATVYRTRWHADVVPAGGCFCNFVYFDAPLTVATPNGNLSTRVWMNLPWPFP